MLYAMTVFIIFEDLSEIRSQVLKNVHWLWSWQGNLSLKQSLGGQKLTYERPVETVVTGRLITQNTEWYREGEANCMEKWWDNRTIESELFFIRQKITEPKFVLCKDTFWPTHIISPDIFSDVMIGSLKLLSAANVREMFPAASE
jgi:hypothetical protein